jgi:hypothetical protein
MIYDKHEKQKSLPKSSLDKVLLMMMIMIIITTTTTTTSDLSKFVNYSSTHFNNTFCFGALLFWGHTTTTDDAIKQTISAAQFMPLPLAFHQRQNR